MQNRQQCSRYLDKAAIKQLTYFLSEATVWQEVSAHKYSPTCPSFLTQTRMKFKQRLVLGSSMQICSQKRLGKASCHMKTTGLPWGTKFSHIPTSKIGCQISEDVCERNISLSLFSTQDLIDLGQLNSGKLGNTEILKTDWLFCEIMERHNPSNQDSGLVSVISPTELTESRKK